MTGCVGLVAAAIIIYTLEFRKYFDVRLSGACMPASANSARHLVCVPTNPLHKLSDTHASW